MKDLRKIKIQQENELKKICLENGVKFDSISRLLEAEKVKKLLRRLAHIQKTIDSEIENAIK